LAVWIKRSVANTIGKPTLAIAVKSLQKVEHCMAESQFPLDRGVGAGDRDRTGDIQLGKLAFYR
jgi:hypothetical protein